MSAMDILVSGLNSRHSEALQDAACGTVHAAQTPVCRCLRQLIGALKGATRGFVVQNCHDVA